MKCRTKEVAGRLILSGIFFQFLYVGTDCFCQMQRCESPAQSGARAKLRAKS
ncbi:hypothetical protein P869_08225 [Ligilactobacillus ruminis S23]|nr:hypothetical protein P869_08225 [Ligilactobacillus ruminis S23]